MKCSEVEKNKPRHHMNLDNLDKALHDLGMLSAITEARRDYMKEGKSNCPVMRRPRFVSYCMKRAPTKCRLCPYVLPVRHRTKSENSDVTSEGDSSGRDVKTNLTEPSTSGYNRDSFDTIKCSPKRCQSLENLNLSVEPQLDTEPSPDMDCVSTQIQKLQVDE